MAAVWPPAADPQNTRIGRLGHIAFASLVVRLRPVATVGLVPTILVMRSVPDRIAPAGPARRLTTGRFAPTGRFL